MQIYLHLGWQDCKNTYPEYNPSDFITGLTKSKLGFYVPFNSQGHIGTGPQNCHLWDSNPQR